jgi:hypothetical protein
LRRPFVPNSGDKPVDKAVENCNVDGRRDACVRRIKRFSSALKRMGRPNVPIV